jgi:uncharacterized membrane protein YheB (UPF0754 family)
MTFDWLPRVLPWLLPPLVGAVIGYITNAVAIRMLFRPLAAKRLFGVRLPLTPGIIPRQRYELAESIGRMVSRELITEEAVRRQLQSAAFRNGLRRNVAGLIEEISLKPLSGFAGENRGLLLSSLENFLDFSLSRFLSSQVFIRAVRELVTRLVSSLAARSPAELLGEQGRLFVRRSAETLLARAAQPEARKQAARGLARWLERQHARPVGDFFPAELARAVSGLAASFLPLLFESLSAWLRREETRREMERRGKRLLRDVLDKLNLLQKFLVSAAQYDRTLEEKMPAIVEEALDSLESAAAENEARLLGVLEGALSAWREKELGELVTAVERKITLPALVESLAELLARPALRERILDVLEGLTGPGQERSTGQLLARVFGIQEQELIEFLSNQALDTLTRPEFARSLAAELVAFSHRFLVAHQDQSLQDLLRLDPAGRQGIADFLTDRLLVILRDRLPGLIQSFNIQEMVETKINELDVAEVENLLLMVIARHLKYINLFGALLGALIGLSQLFFGFWQQH